MYPRRKRLSVESSKDLTNCFIIALQNYKKCQVIAIVTAIVAMIISYDSGAQIGYVLPREHRLWRYLLSGDEETDPGCRHEVNMLHDE